MEKNLGHATAYGYAKSKGYSGTEEEFAELMADYASVGQSAAQSAEQAAASATSASASAQTASQAAQTATDKASDAIIAESVATAKASDAQVYATSANQSAESAGTSAQTATTAATTATTKASEAAVSANTATTAKTDAETARDAAAHSASEAAESARTLTIDTTLTQAGQAADAKAVRDRVEGIKGEITDNTGTESLEWTAGIFYQIVNDFVDINTPSSGVNWRASVTQASEGDVFYVYTKGGSVDPAWIFIDANGEVLTKAPDFLQAGVVITAPANTAYLILNDNLKTNNSYKGLPLKNDIAEEFNSINAMLGKCVYANGTVSNYSNVLDIPNNTITRIPANTTAEAFSGLPNDFYGRAGSIVRLSSYADAGKDGYACFILYELNTEMYFGFSGGSSVTWIKLKNNNGILVASGNISSAGASITDISAGIYKVASTLTEDVFAGLPVYGKYGTFVKIIPLIPSTTGTGFEAYAFFTVDNVYFGFNTANSIIWRSMVDIQPKAYQDIDDVICTLGRTTNQIVLMGDSITAGVGGTGYNGTVSPTVDPVDTSGGLIVEMNIGRFYRNSTGYCWANELKSYIEANYPNTTVINNGCTGTHSDQGDIYFNQLVPEGTTILIVSYGINDRGSASIDTIVRLNNIIQKATARGIKVILMTPKPVTQNESSYAYSSYQVMQKVKTVAVNNNMEPGDMWAEFNKYCFITDTDMSTLMPDGLHPNDAGYTAMFNLTKFILGV